MTTTRERKTAARALRKVIWDIGVIAQSSGAEEAEALARASGDLARATERLAGTTKDGEIPVPGATAVVWSGKCDCGCGGYNAYLVDEQKRPFAKFGYLPRQWQAFFTEVMASIEETESAQTSRGPAQR
jgi:hypothetical protein